MTPILLFAAGLGTLGLAALLIIRGLPRGGQIQAVAAANATGELYAFAILICLAMGVAFILNAIL